MQFSAIAVIYIMLIIVVRAEGPLVSIVVSLPCTAYLCGSLIVSCDCVFSFQLITFCRLLRLSLTCYQLSLPCLF